MAAASAPWERNDWNASRVDTARTVWTGPRGGCRYVSFSSLLIPISSSYPYHRHSFRHLAMPSSAFFLRAGLALVSFTSTVFQQASAQSPTGTWKPRPSCQLGGDPSANNGLGGGIYVDKFGGQWDMRCSTGLTGTVVVAGTTNGQGIYGCAKGCAKRPSCIAFTYANSSLVAITDTTGSGPCSYRFIVGDYVLDTARPVTTYAAAVLIRANTQLPVSRCDISIDDGVSDTSCAVPCLQWWCFHRFYWLRLADLLQHQHRWRR